MTGTILTLASAYHAGTIRSADGSHLRFAAAAVVGDLDLLAIGHHVSFDIELDGARRQAVRVFHEPLRRPVPTRKPDGGPDLRYVGFLHEGNVRVYRFERLAVGQKVEHSIALDLKLLLKHHIGVQELPALCANKLAADLKTKPDILVHQLSDDDLLQFAAARSAATKRRAAARHSFHRGPAPPGVALGKDENVS